MHIPGLQVKGLQAAISRKTLHVHRQLHHTTGTAGKNFSKAAIHSGEHKNAVSHFGDDFIMLLVSQEVSHFPYKWSCSTIQPHPFFGSMWTGEERDAI